MARKADVALQAKILQVGFVVVFIAVVMYSVRSLMFGSGMLVKLVALGLISAAIVIALDERYWLFSILLFGFSSTLPVVKFTGAELGSIILIATFFVRMALRRDIFVFRSKRLIWAALPFLAWMCLVWSMNPVGMNIFGSSSIGGRFYLKVILAFSAMVCLFFIPFSDKDCKHATVTFVMGNVLFVFRSVLVGEQDQFGAPMETHYQYAHLYYVAMFFLCRYSAADILSRFWVFLGFLTTFGLTVFSGNRHSVGEAVLCGATVPFLLKRDRFRTLVLMGFVAFFLAVVVSGQGRLWDLPYSIQRSMSFLPGKWDYRLDEYGFNDNFRATLRMYAREHIAENPWFGDQGFSMDTEEMAWTYSQTVNTGDIYSLHILSRNWHNVWLGMAADFGIPLSVAWALFSGVVLVFGLRNCRAFPPGSWRETAFVFFFMLCAVSFVDFFYAGGHTAKTPERWFVWVGLMAAIQGGFLQSRRDDVFSQSAM